MPFPQSAKTGDAPTPQDDRSSAVGDAQSEGRATHVSVRTTLHHRRTQVAVAAALVTISTAPMGAFAVDGTSPIEGTTPVEGAPADIADDGEELVDEVVSDSGVEATGTVGAAPGPNDSTVTSGDPAADAIDVSSDPPSGSSADAAPVPQVPAPAPDVPATPPPTSDVPPVSTATDVPPVPSSTTEYSGSGPSSLVVELERESVRLNASGALDAAVAATTSTTAHPGAERAVPAAVVERARRARPGDRTHLVQVGESLWLISTDVLGGEPSVAVVARKVGQLWKLNAKRIGTGDPNLLRVGTRLKLR